MTLRLFFALELDQTVREKISRQIETLKKETAFRWVRPENLHLTTRFLGAVEETKIKKIREVLRTPVESFASFECSLHTIGGFPNAKACRVVWFGLSKGSDQCGELKKIIDNAIFPIGLSKEEGKFIPHLTLARSKTEPRDIHELQAIASSFEEIPCGTLRLLTLFSSDLTSIGPVYKPIFKLHFK